MNLTWWCAATGASWSWEWKAFPGVWLFVALLGLGYWRWTTSPVGPAGTPARTADRLWFLTGLLLLWFALDWPLGLLGAGYLASAHTVSYILLSLVVPPCLILGVPADHWRRAASQGVVGPLLRALARPTVAFPVYSVLLLGTHVPSVVDGLMRSQAGALLIDLGWMVAGFALWWPVMAPEPGHLSRPLKMTYLFVCSLPSIIPSAFMTFAQYPIYSTYELAPRIFTVMTAVEDQRAAGLLMKIVGDLPLWLAFGVIFFRWARATGGTPPNAHQRLEVPLEHR